MHIFTLSKQARNALVMAALTFSGSAYAFTPVAPTGLKADTNGSVVTLSWEWGNAGSAVSTFGFEGDELPANCQVKSTNTNPDLNWCTFNYEDIEGPLAHSGTYSALLQIGMDDEPNPADNHQDEWLILTPGAGAVYMDFWYYIHPELAEVGPIQAFPDHYYVHISRDNGNTWTALWDGRWDVTREDAVRQASIFLDEPTDENTLVAFQAVSDAETSLFFMWAVDDVEFLTAEEKAAAPLKVKAGKDSHKALSQAIKGIKVKRDFTSSDTKKAVRRAPERELLNNGFTTFRVYVDDVLVGDYLKTRNFTDYSNKEEGDYVYHVMAWNERTDTEYAKSSVEVYISQTHFSTPKNVKAAYKAEVDQDGNPTGKYEVYASWDAPESDLQPSHYNVYMNGKSIGWINSDEEFSLGKSGVPSYLYDFAVEAVYLYPEGTSERVHAFTAPGTVYGVENFQAVARGTGYELTWSPSSFSEEAPTGYNVYRGDLLLAENQKECSYSDSNVPAGAFSYSVHAVYADGSVSLPASTTIEEAPEIMEVPFKETFDNGHLPANWTTTLIDPYDNVREMYSWRFDNWFGIDVDSSLGFEGGFASISGPVGGMNKLDAHLSTPPFAVTKTTMLVFNKCFSEEKAGPSGPAQVLTRVSTDGGENWIDFDNETIWDNGRREISLEEFAGQTIMVRWSFLGRMSGVFAIDNVEVYDTSSSITDITDDNDCPTVTIYTTSGVTVATNVNRDSIRNLAPGIYIVTTPDGKVEKVYVK